MASNRKVAVERKVLADKRGSGAIIDQPLQVRRRPDYPGGQAPTAFARRCWIGSDPIASAWFNALSATFPRGEAFFIDSVRACAAGAPEPLASQIRDFIAQEANHSREHVAFNRMVAAAGYDLARIDTRTERLLEKARARSETANIAVTMALEHFTAIFAHDLLAHPELLADADPALAALWRWHAIEEIEHKGVAFDAFLHATRDWPGWRRWLLRSMMMLVVTKTFFTNRVKDVLDLLRQDGLTGPKVWRQVWRFLFRRPGVLRRILPAWRAWFAPGFHPWTVDDRALITD